MKRKIRKRVLSIAGIDPVKLLGVKDRNIKLIEEYFDHDITVRGEEVILSGTAEDIDVVSEVLETLLRIAAEGRSITEGDVMSVIRGDGGEQMKIGTLDETTVFFSPLRRRNITPRSIRQKEYVDAVRDNDVVFAIGPAGTSCDDGYRSLTRSAQAAIRRGATSGEQALTSPYCRFFRP